MIEWKKIQQDQHSWTGKNNISFFSTSDSQVASNRDPPVGIFHLTRPAIPFRESARVLTEASTCICGCRTICWQSVIRGGDQVFLLMSLTYTIGVASNITYMGFFTRTVGWRTVGTGVKQQWESRGKREHFQWKSLSVLFCLAIFSFGFKKVFPKPKF